MTPEVGDSRPRGLAWYKVDDLSAAQVAAMQHVDDARRAGVLTSDQADELFAMVRDGKVAGVRKRLTQARKAPQS